MRAAAATWLIALSAACQDEPMENALDRTLQRMVDQRRCSADEPSTHFRNGACDLAPPEGTRAYRQAAESAESRGASDDGQPLAEVPIPVDRALISEGKGRFELFCAPCHGLLGDGQSEVAENMQLRKPPALFDPVVQDLPDGQIFRVISQGYGLMPSYAHALTAHQRWAVVAYVRVLALSQAMPLGALAPEAQRAARSWLR